MVKGLKLKQFQLVESFSMSSGQDIQVDEFGKDLFLLPWQNDKRNRADVASAYERFQNAASSSGGSRSLFDYFLSYAQSDPGGQLRASTRPSSPFPYTVRGLPRHGERDEDHLVVY